MTLARAILNQDVTQIKRYLDSGADIEAIDEFGFTPLIETAIINDCTLTELLLSYGANARGTDLVGGTALYWAVENNNVPMVRALLEKGANPNAYNHNGEPILSKTILRPCSSAVKHMLYEHGGQARFALDYINTKLFGHRYDLRGSVDIVDADGDYIEVGLEGFVLEFSLGLVRNALEQYIKNYAARTHRKDFHWFHACIQSLDIANELMQYTQYKTVLDAHADRIDYLLDHEPLIIPVGYQGHAVTFVKYKQYWVRCDRRRSGLMLNGVNVFVFKNKNLCTKKFLRRLLFEKHNSDWIENEINQELNLSFKTRIILPPQISGNCSWANVTASVPALYYVLSDYVNDACDFIDGDHPVVTLYRDWKHWDQLRALQYFMIQFETHDNKKRRAFIASLLTRLMFQRFSYQDASILPYAQRILKLLRNTGYDYIIQNYLDYYFHYQKTKGGKNFKQLIEASDHML